MNDMPGLPAMRRLKLPVDAALVRCSSLAALEAEHERCSLLLRALVAGGGDGEQLLWRRYPYGLLDAQHDRQGAGSTLYLLHNAGLFSCLTTLVWTVLSIQRQGLRPPSRVSALFGLDAFKSCATIDCLARWFDPPDPADLEALAQLSPASELQPGPHPFDHHGDYSDLFHALLGRDWWDAFVRTYLKPSASLAARVDDLLQRYALAREPTLVVCLRGTDKHTELVQDSLATYLASAQALVATQRPAQLLIQTDQWQIRERFCHEFGSLCRFIGELPVTLGTRVMHQALPRHCDIDAWAQTVLAMVLACSQARCVLTHTGNVGLFLALLTQLRGGQVVQLR